MADYRELEPRIMPAGPSLDSESILRDMTPSQKFQQEDRELIVRPFLLRIQYFSIFLLSTSWILPLTCWFAGPHRWIFYASLGVFIAHLVIGALGFFVVKGNEDRYIRMKRYRLLLNIFFLGFLTVVIVYEAFGLGFAVQHNRDNCKDYDNNKVCSKRWGVMSEQIILMMILPAVNIWICISYAYITTLTKECLSKLIERTL